MPSVAGGKSATGTIAVPCGRPGRLRASRSPVFRQVPCSRPGKNRTILCSLTRSPACSCSRRCGTLETAFYNCIFKRVKYPTFKKSATAASLSSAARPSVVAMESGSEACKPPTMTVSLSSAGRSHHPAAPPSREPPPRSGGQLPDAGAAACITIATSIPARIFWPPDWRQSQPWGSCHGNGLERRALTKKGDGPELPQQHLRPAGAGAAGAVKRAAASQAQCPGGQKWMSLDRCILRNG